MALQYAENCYYGYLNAEPPVRRLYNQAFFERIELSELDATGTLNEPFDAIRAAVSTADDVALTKRPRTPRVTRDDHAGNKPAHDDAGLKESVLVPPAGFEPAAFCSGGRRSIP